MKKTLLEQAQKVKVYPSWKRIQITDEHIELALAWLREEVRPKQIAAALGRSLEAGNYQRLLAQYLREAYRKGRIVIN